MDDLRVVYALLFFAELYYAVFFKLVRKILEHVLFEPAQYERRHHLLKPSHSLFISVFYYRRLKLLLERIITVQEPRHEKVKYAPKLAQPVFNRRTCKRELMGAFYDFYSFRRSRRMILYILCFIYYFIRKFLAVVAAYIAL